VPNSVAPTSSPATLPSLGYVPRRPRSLYAGIYHLAAHGSDTRHLFVTDEDRQDFLERLAAACEEFDLALTSYVVMGTHYHTLLRVPDARLPRPCSVSIRSTRATTTPPSAQRAPLPRARNDTRDHQ